MSRPEGRRPAGTRAASMSSMKIGLMLPLGADETRGFDELREMALAAEAGGLDSVWGADHLIFRDDGTTTGIHESWTVLTAVAAITVARRDRAARAGAPLPQPGADGEDGGPARRGQRRAPHPRPRLRLASARVRRLRLPVRPPRRPLRGGARDPRAAPARRARELRGPIPPRGGRSSCCRGRSAPAARRSSSPASSRACSAWLRSTPTSGTARGTASRTRPTSCARASRTFAARSTTRAAIRRP